MTVYQEKLVNILHSKFEHKRSKPYKNETVIKIHKSELSGHFSDKQNWKKILFFIFSSYLKPSADREIHGWSKKNYHRILPLESKFEENPYWHRWFFPVFSGSDRSIIVCGVIPKYTRGPLQRLTKKCVRVDFFAASAFKTVVSDRDSNGPGTMPNYGVNRVVSLYTPRTFAYSSRYRCAMIWSVKLP